jgi:xylulokinase
MILACDIGTTTVKAGIIDHKGGLKAYSRVMLSDPYNHKFPAREWRRRFTQAVYALGADEIKKIRAVVISGNGPSIVLLDAEGKALDHVLLWHHQPVKSDESTSTSSYFLPLLARLAEYNPHIYDKTHTLLPCPEYICYLLTGRMAALLPNSAFRDYYWSDTEIKVLGLDKVKFPEFIDLTAVFGRTTRSASGEYAVPHGVPVYCGGPDFLMALLGSGVITPGRTLDRAGSSEGINYCAAKKIIHGDLRTLPGLLENTYNISGILPLSGRLLEQAAASFFPHSATVAEACSEALTVKPCAHGLLFIPHSMRQRNLRGSKNLPGTFYGLRDDHGPPVKLRAVMEAIVMQLRLKLHIIREQGSEIADITICGGQTRSLGLAQLRADIFKIAIKLPVVTDAELIGGACVAAHALEEYNTLQQAAQSMVQFSQQLEPRKEYEHMYEDLFGRFCSFV